MTITKRLYCNTYPYKRGFPTEVDAKISLISINDDSLREKIPIRCYQCENCALWHTTSEILEKYNENTRQTSSKETAKATRRVFEAIQIDKASKQQK